MLMLVLCPGYLLDLGQGESVQAGGVDIEAPGYPVPSFDYWDGDTLKDLIVGEGNGSLPVAKVRVYLNVGTSTEPQFDDFFSVHFPGAGASN